MKKNDIEVYYDRGGRYPSINVKVNRFAQGLSAEQLDCSEETLEKAMEYALQMATERFWEDAEKIAYHHLGKVKVYGLGRCGGHLCVEGLSNVETWDAIKVSAWARFEKAILNNMKWLCSAESVREDILANRWNEEGAELYNYIATKDGETVCLSEMKVKAISAGFAPVIR
jgi:hypothetical protein